MVYPVPGEVVTVSSCVPLEGTSVTGGPRSSDPRERHRGTFSLSVVLGGLERGDELTVAPVTRRRGGKVVSESKSERDHSRSTEVLLHI